MHPPFWTPAAPHAIIAAPKPTTRDQDKETATADWNNSKNRRCRQPSRQLAQVRRARAAVRRQSCRHLGNFQAMDRAFTTISLGIPSRGLQIETQDRRAIETRRPQWSRRTDCERIRPTVVSTGLT